MDINHVSSYHKRKETQIKKTNDDEKSQQQSWFKALSSLDIPSAADTMMAQFENILPFRIGQTTGTVIAAGQF